MLIRIHNSWRCGPGLGVIPAFDDALTDDALDRFAGVGAIIAAVGGAGIVSELELGEVTAQVLLTTIAASG